jgi:thioredoxin-like negative regulator of GroEL
MLYDAALGEIWGRAFQLMGVAQEDLDEGAIHTLRSSVISEIVQQAVDAKALAQNERAWARRAAEHDLAALVAVIMHRSGRRELITGPLFGHVRAPRIDPEQREMNKKVGVTDETYLKYNRQG